MYLFKKTSTLKLMKNILNNLFRRYVLDSFLDESRMAYNLKNVQLGPRRANIPDNLSSNPVIKEEAICEVRGRMPTSIDNYLFQTFQSSLPLVPFLVETVFNVCSSAPIRFTVVTTPELRRNNW